MATERQSWEELEPHLDNGRDGGRTVCSAMLVNQGCGSAGRPSSRSTLACCLVMAASHAGVGKYCWVESIIMAEGIRRLYAEALPDFANADIVDLDPSMRGRANSHVSSPRGSSRVPVRRLWICQCRSTANVSHARGSVDNLVISEAVRGGILQSSGLERLRSAVNARPGLVVEQYPALGIPPRCQPVPVRTQTSDGRLVTRWMPGVAVPCWPPAPAQHARLWGWCSGSAMYCYRHEAVGHFLAAELRAPVLPPAGGPPQLQEPGSRGVIVERGENPATGVPASDARRPGKAAAESGPITKLPTIRRNSTDPRRLPQYAYRVGGLGRVTPAMVLSSKCSSGPPDLDPSAVVPPRGAPDEDLCHLVVARLLSSPRLPQEHSSETGAGLAQLFDAIE
ncbi:hypothetical protein B2J93_3556 [Marssonina coronariae]|uniref:Uncharacterized protein n=1 Tax=Diplocarpon coronariae TaxID=2795749 RepID=A0A218Z712_9HELO|nr:hypothetical protein B2J93_3556 [Marssonina coronariae]